MNGEPIFKNIFGKDWESLPPVMRKHYANRPNSHDTVTATGMMDVTLSPLAQLLSPLLRLFGALVPYAGQKIPVTVTYHSQPNSDVFVLDRLFYFPQNNKPYRFRSRMQQIKGNDVSEAMRFGLSWRMRYVWDGTRVLLLHRGYAVRLGRWLIPMPFSILIGRGHAEEEAISESEFRMEMTLIHPIFGQVFKYRGEFTIND